MTDSRQSKLDALRAELDRIDRELVDRAAERQRIVSEIGRLKKSSGRALRDFRRERQALDGLGHLHEKRTVHRDIKPSNLMVVPDPPKGGPDTTRLSSLLKDLIITPSGGSYH